MYKVTYKHPVLDARVEITYPLHLGSRRSRTRRRFLGRRLEDG